MLEGVVFRRLSLVAFLAAAVLAVGVSACGSDDDGGDGSAGSDAAAQSAGGESGDPKKQLEADYDEFVDHIYKGRWKQACAGYSDAYVKVYPKQVQIARTCEKTMDKEYQTVSTSPRPWVAKVIVKSPTRAIGYSKIRADAQGNPIKFVKENGTWKLDGPVPQTQQQ